MNDGHDDFESHRPSVIVATTVVSLVLAASAVLWRSHSKDGHTRADSFKTHENVREGVTENEAGMAKPARSKERRRRGKDPMKELMKGGKKSKELNKLINSISLHPTSPSPPALRRPSRDFDHSSDHDHRDASVSSFKSNSSRAEPEDEHDPEQIPPTNGSTSNDAAQSQFSVQEEVSPASNLSDYPISLATSIDNDNKPNYSIINPKHGHPPRTRRSETPPSLTSSHSNPLSSTRSDVDRGEGPSNFTPMPLLASNTSSSHGNLLVEGVNSSLSSTMQVIDPSTSLKRGRKRNKSLTSRNTHLCGDSQPPDPSSFTQTTMFIPTDVGQPQSPLSTQTQLASLRGALEAARLREEKTHHEIERLRWEAQLAKRREAEYQAYMNYLTHQLHSYASFAVAMQAPTQQFPAHQASGSYLHPNHSIHGPSTSVDSSSMSISGSSLTTDQGTSSFDSETSQQPRSPSSGIPPNDQSHSSAASTMPVTFLPSPSETLSSPTQLSPFSVQSPTYTNPYIVKPTESVLSSEIPESSSSTNTLSTSIPPQPFIPPSAYNPGNSPLPQQSPFMPPPVGYEATTNRFADFSGVTPVSYYAGPPYSTVPFSHAYPPTLFEQGRGKNKVQSKGKSNRKSKEKREKDPISVKDEGGQQPSVTTFSDDGDGIMPTSSENFHSTGSRPPSPATIMTQHDTGSSMSCKADPSDCSSSSSSSLPSTPSSRSRSHHSPRSHQLPKTLVMSETLPPMAPQSFSPLEMLGLNMERVRESSRAGAKKLAHSVGLSSRSSYSNIGHDARNGDLYCAGINEGREDGDGLFPGSGYGAYGSPNSLYGNGSSNGEEGFLHEEGPLNDMLADAILKRPEAMRMGSMSRISEAKPDNDRMDESARESSVTEEETRKLPADPILEFTFPSLSNWGSIQSAKAAQRTHEFWVEKAQSSPPPSPPATLDDDLRQTDKL